ncbi:cupin domain-containing protein [Pseudomonas alliivorans]|nr:cupin domain-containing protein [Pseudomonas alliivorans]MEE5095165.1 cupin domain-containing protein [Pseudomonas alliivorans]MEE5103460.1 cupin domain-containing protein [Pseudomonas alliivorans]MEE5170007.1 cupin domain-containing protein [Pseudomonas alliivorans]
MRTLTALSTLASMLLPLAANAADVARGASMSIVRNGEQASIMGAPANFVGAARIDPLFPARSPSRVSAAYVTFQPGARSMWHTHPLGQTLVVTSGTGWIQQEGGEKQAIKPGDVIWTPPGVKHWHGATSTTGMTHMAIQEAQNGKNVEWLEPVTDAQYEAGR